ncbi:hypothetical protein [Cryptosporangium minutisporangium]|uniref:Uncharacterized protein n=1 Tax=Cryptosporangium minutisporangium TaxID=113569 RepID=A0ABP6SNL1_9ACTN
MSAIDDSGRIADRSTVRALGWLPGTAVAVSAAPRIVAVIARADAAESITQQGRLRLHHTTRAVAGIRTGDRLLLAAYLDRRLLIVYTMRLLHQLLDAHHARPGAEFPS